MYILATVFFNGQKGPFFLPLFFLEIPLYFKNEDRKMFLKYIRNFGKK